jgi:uncharacterized protein (DUF1501 family)
MQAVSRRAFLILGAAAGAFGLLSKVPLARASDSRPHFLISIQIRGGTDNAYMFDGRGPTLTEKNLKQNYLLRNDQNPTATTPGEFTSDKLQERTIVCGETGCTALRSPLFDALWSAHRSRFSIVNGLHMLENSVGHEENSSYLWSNAERGGRAIFPPLVAKLSSGLPLDTLILRGPGAPSFSSAPNVAGSAELAVEDLAALSDALTSGPRVDEGSPMWKHIVARADSNASQQGLFATGSQNFARALRRVKATGDALGGTGGGTGSGEPSGGLAAGSLSEAVRRVLQFFAGGMTRVATILQVENVDTHSAASAQNDTVALYTRIAADLVTALDLLGSTVFTDTDGRPFPFSELTTFMITSEFGRTNRSIEFPAGASVGATGSDHNPFSNSALIGGRGIRGGLIVGESDLRDCDEDANFTAVSGAHRQKNAPLNSIMGKPFDFATQRLRSDLPERYDPRDYINMPSVTNTLLDAFGVPAESHFQLGSRPAPVLDVLRDRRTA